MMSEASEDPSTNLSNACQSGPKKSGLQLLVSTLSKFEAAKPCICTIEQKYPETTTTITLEQLFAKLRPQNEKGCECCRNTDPTEK